MNVFRAIQLTFLLSTLYCLTATAQQTSGIVSYNRVQNGIKVYSRLTFLSREEKDRIEQTFKNDKAQTVKLKLLFTPDQSLFTHESEQSQNEDGTYSWRNKEYIVQRNFKDGKKTEIEEAMGKTYIVEDSLQTPNWKIMNQIKDIAGHICMKAVTEDTIRQQTITAWFAQDIPVSAGPERYFGLPGLILELDINDGAVVVTATKVEFKDVSKEMALPKKLKGRRVNTAEYNRLVAEHIQNSIKEHYNPYWEIRY